MTVSADKENSSRTVEPARVFTPGRIAALLFIAAAVAGLAHLRFAPDADSVSVPAWTKAGDLILEPVVRQSKAPAVPRGERTAG